MRKRYYSDYVRHMVRFYNSRKSEPTPPNDLNFKICEKVFKRYDGNVETIMCEFCTNDLNLSDNEFVDYICDKLTVSPVEVWRTIRQLEREIASERGLLNDTE